MGTKQTPQNLSDLGIQEHEFEVETVDLPDGGGEIIYHFTPTAKEILRAAAEREKISVDEYLKRLIFPPKFWSQ